MTYLIIFFLLLAVLQFYFRLAEHYNIIDKPNNRSSHASITIRGGGIVYYISALFYFVWSDFQYPYFFAGLSLITCVSFLDDIYTLSNKLRLTIHFFSVLLLCYQLLLFEQSLYIISLALFVIIGAINAYNFMDGINGITAMYSFSVLLLLWICNNQYHFIDVRLLHCVAIGNLVFAIFNFRNQAKCFAGDIGSVCMSFLLIFMLSRLLLQEQRLIYILFLVVYGVDAVLTIVHRLIRKENIFEAHRTHLYQYLSNEAKVNKLIVATSYGLLQLFIGIAVIYSSAWSNVAQTVFVISLLLILSILYIVLKRYILKKYVMSNI